MLKGAIAPNLDRTALVDTQPTALQGARIVQIPTQVIELVTRFLKASTTHQSWLLSSTFVSSPPDFVAMAPKAEKKPAQPAKKAVAKKSSAGRKKGSKKAVESYKIYIYKVNHAASLPVLHPPACISNESPTSFRT